MTSPLRAEIQAMEVFERGVYVRRLGRMHPVELQRENNIARNRALMRGLDLMHASSFVGMKRKREEDKEKKKRVGDEDDWDSDENEDEDDETECEPSTPVRTRSAKAKGKAAAAGPSMKGGAPKWITNAQEMLLDSEGAEMGKEWKELVGLWYRVEESSKFVTSVSCSGWEDL
jgi:hypothetical protein